MVANLIKVGLLTLFMVFPASTWSFEGPGVCPMQIGGGERGKFSPTPGMHGRPGLGKWWAHSEVREKLGLSQEQVDSLSKLALETETKLIEVNAKLQIARLKLRDIGMKKETSQESIDQLVNEIGDLHKDQLKAFINQRRGTLNTLNEDQIKKVEKFLAVRKDRMKRGPDWAKRPLDYDKAQGKAKDYNKEKGKKWDRDKDGDKDRDRDRDREGMRGRDGDRGDGRPGPPDREGPQGRRGFGMAPEGMPGFPGGGPGMFPPPGMPGGQFGAPPALGGPAGPAPEGALDMEGPNAEEGANLPFDQPEDSAMGPEMSEADPLDALLSFEGLPIFGGPIDEDLIADFE